MTKAEAFKITMAQLVESSGAEVRTEVGIVTMKFDDGSILDFTNPEVKETKKENQ